MSRRLLELDGLRGLAILFVVVWHCFVLPLGGVPLPSFLTPLMVVGSFGWSGVDLFFVLSGFLIGGILIDARDSEGFFRFFYARRALRILPIYVLICAVYAVAWCTPALIDRAALVAAVGAPMPWWSYATFTQNFQVASHGWGPFLAATWSLAVEEQFYLTLPVLIYLTPRRLLPWLIATLLLLVTIGRVALYLHHDIDNTAAYVLPYTRGDSLLCGVLAALTVRAERTPRLVRLVRVGLLLSAVGVVVMLLRRWTWDTRPMYTLGFSVWAGFYTFSLLTAVLHPESRFGSFLRFRPLRWLGSIAYGLYLLHQPILGIFERSRKAESWRDLGVNVLALAVTLLICDLSWRFFESKMVAFGHGLHAHGRRADRGRRPQDTPA